MGIINYSFPFFTMVQTILDSFLSPFVGLLVWAGLAAVISMLLYFILSFQQAIAACKEDIQDHKKALYAYEGEFLAVLPLMRRYIVCSLKQVWLTLIPAIGASIPLIYLIGWMSLSLSYIAPEQGQRINVTIIPSDAPIVINPGLQTEEGQWLINWPSNIQRVEIRKKSGGVTAVITHKKRMPIIHKQQWWNSIISNPEGYLDDNDSVEEIHITLPVREYIHVGPEWVRSWELTFFVSLIIFSLCIKYIFRIH